MASSSGSFGLLGLFVISQLASHKTGSAGFNLQHCEIEPLFNNWPIINPFVRKKNLIFLEPILKFEVKILKKSLPFTIDRASTSTGLSTSHK